MFALSLRQPKLSETVNKEITEVFYNIDKALSLFAESDIYQGVSKQQFTITAANNLADFLSNVLDNMQENLSISPSQGQGDMQMPDIIMSQDQLNKMMEEGMKKGEKGNPKHVGEGEEGEKTKDGYKGKEGGKNGKQTGEGHNGDKQGGNGLNDNLNGELYEIYQKQQALRQALEDKIAKEGLGGSGEKLVKQMEAIELDLLNKGFTNQTLQKMIQLQHQLLKMDNAAFQQGQDIKRKSDTNFNNYTNTTNSNLSRAKQYFRSTEILNRQALPLRQVYKNKVQVYFKDNND